MAEFILKIIVGFLCIFASSQVSTLHNVAPERNFDELPYCDPSNTGWKHKDSRLILVSTLDGRLSALDIEAGGEVAWSLDTGPGAMLSSSIHQLELTKNGHWARMIPSLSGGLYNFNGDSVEAIPVTADNLLHSDFQYSDGSVITGGKESRTYGVLANSGRLIYECSMEGCVNLTEGMSSKEDDNNILVIRRQTQTVRAIEPQTGTERWNFSVAQHDVKFLNDHSPECHGDKETTVQKMPEDYQVKVVVPDGIVCIVSKMQPDKIIWKQKFHSPVVHAWRLDDGQMSAVDLFSNALLASLNLEEYSNLNVDPPKLYIGMYNKQLYIQESIQMQAIMKRQYLQITSGSGHIPRIPWRPFPASRGSLDIIRPQTSEEETALQPVDTSSSDSTTSLSVLYASEYINGNGFYLFSEEEKQKPSKATICSNEDATNHTSHNTSNLDEFNYLDDDDEMPVQIIVSLWFWWKEVLAISIATALFVNLVFTQRFLRLMRFRMARQMGFKRELIMDGDCIPLICENDSGIGIYLTKRSYSESKADEVRNAYKTPKFTSRYLTDFEPMHRLGKGGFGVVFEARNKIDDCNYAIKRIPLSNRQDSRDRVMREVKALAKLDHQNIVRYFNAWLECPPPGWQEEQDKVWIDNGLLSESQFSITPRDATSIDLSLNSNQCNASQNGRSQMKRPNIIPPYTFPVLGSDTSVWLNQSSGASSNTATQSGSFLNESSGTSQSDSFIVFADGSNTGKQNGEKEDIIGAFEELSKSKDLLIRQSKELPRDSDSPEPNLKQVVVVEKNKQLVVSKLMDDALGQKSHNKKWKKKSLSLDLMSSNDQCQENERQIQNKSTRVYLYIQMQLCRKESLREWLRDERCEVDRKESLNIFDQIVQAVEYVHLRGLIHRDLKPSNIFFSQEGQIKVGDFGLVTAMAETVDNITTCEKDELNSLENRRHTAQVGTQLYMSPEQLMGKPYNYKVDIYSLGLILFELLVPFNTQMERLRILKDLRDNKFPPKFQFEHSEEFQLLTLMLSQDPENRPTTFGIRARPPLLELQDASIKDISESLHYNLPVRKNSSNSSLSQSKQQQ